MSVATRPVLTGAIPPLDPGTWTPDGTPATIDAGSGYKAFPGVTRLGPSRLLLVYCSGTGHTTGHVLTGRIGVLSGTTVTWGAEFTIKSHATNSILADDGVAVVDGRAVVAYRRYTGSGSVDPTIAVCDDLASEMTEASTWTEYAIAFSEGATDNLPTGPVFKSGSTYIVGAYHDSGANWIAGVLRSSSLTDWSAPTWVAITGTSYSEVGLFKVPGGLRANIRKEGASNVIETALSTDDGATWGSVASAHDGHGHPSTRQLLDGSYLTVFRDSPAGDTMYRTSSDGTTWSAETSLDGVGTDNMYASVVPLTPTKALAVYAAQITASDADIYSQVFTRS